VVGGIVLIIVLFKWQDLANRPERHAKHYLEAPKSREAYRAPGYQKVAQLPNLDYIQVTNTKLIQKMGEGDNAAVDVVVTLTARQVVGTSQAIKDQEAGKKGPTHQVVMRWQKLRDGQVASNGKWMLLAMEVTQLAQQGAAPGPPAGPARR
jgi:hypothetical protein